MGVRKLGVATIVLVAVLLTVPAGASGASISRPTWTVGDYWTYRSNTTLTPGLNLTGTATSTVEGTLPAAVDTSPAGSFRVILSGSGTTGGTVQTPQGPISVQGRWILTGEEHYEPDNLQLVYSLLDLSVNGTYSGVLPFSLRFQNTTTFRILDTPMRYPYSVGGSGTVRMWYNFTQDLSSPIAGTFHTNGTGQRDLAWTVGDPAAVSTPAGTFQAYPIARDLIDGAFEVGYYAPSVGNDVRTDGYAVGGNRTAEDSLIAYRYQAAETPTYLGLTVMQWALVVAVAGAVAVLATVWIVRSRRRRARPPETEPPVPPTSGPRGP